MLIKGFFSPTTKKQAHLPHPLQKQAIAKQREMKSKLYHRHQHSMQEESGRRHLHEGGSWGLPYGLKSNSNSFSWNQMIQLECRIVLFAKENKTIGFNGDDELPWEKYLSDIS
jgi:hypothetical protein